MNPDRHVRPATDEYAPYYEKYISQQPDGDVLAALRAQIELLERLPAATGAARETFAYAPGKWSVRQVVGHLGDAERVFGYRAFCFSRGEQAALPSFDENHYVAASGAADRPLADLVAELSTLRRANLSTLAAVGAEAWRHTGIASGQPVSVRALAWILAGHVTHHLRILDERYGIAV
jgi:hypothetical protein